MKKLLSTIFGALIMIAPASADIPSIPGPDPLLSDTWTLVPLIGLLAVVGVIAGIAITVITVMISKKRPKKK